MFALVSAICHRHIAIWDFQVSPSKEISRNDIKSFLLIWSEWRDSNSRHPGPKPGALPAGPHPETITHYTRPVRKKQVKSVWEYKYSHDYYTLNRKLTMSPSFITYSLPSLRTRPFDFAFAIVPHSFISWNAITSARIKPRSKSVWILPAA